MKSNASAGRTQWGLSFGRADEDTKEHIYGVTY